VTNSRVSIWFFIGVLLTVYGVLITGAGLYGLVHPPAVKLAWLHAGLWWGMLLVVIGGVYTYAFFPARRTRQRGPDVGADR
jgi:heme/copper-type cytochrome/quinol oxidase subunit 2